MIVCDSGPLIHLARIGELQILRTLFGEVLIPFSVYEEVVVEAKRLRKTGVSTIEEAITSGWIKVLKLTPSDLREVRRLAEEESIEIADAEVVYLARKKETGMVTNDRRLVLVARALGVQPLWITSLLFLAVSRKVLKKSEAASLLRRLVRSGLHLRPEVYEATLEGIEKS